jgi:hypothetical protein
MIFHSERLVFKDVYSPHEILFVDLDIENQVEKRINSVLCSLHLQIFFGRTVQHECIIRRRRMSIHMFQLRNYSTDFY